MTDDDRGFYVGYLPTPERDVLWTRVFVVLVVLASLGLAWAFSAFARPTGQGVWDTGHEVALEGELVVHPFPMLRVPRPDGSVERVLLVEMGKRGADARVAPYAANDGSPVSVQARGFLIERDGQRMLELADGDALSSARVLPPIGKPEVIGPVELEGEIVDSKCWLGVMKPGDGKAHRDCATLCIRGGIPPSIVCRAPDGSTRRALVVGGDGAPLPIAVLAPWIARPVRVRGEAERLDGIAVIRVTEFAAID
ncbi:MAG: hypothetical protein RJA05_2078 [Planctomycetota bacterium]|jgi:hypothetical protein